MQSYYDILLERIKQVICNILTQLEVSEGFLIKPKTNTDTKLTNVLRCRGFDQKNTETSSGRFRRCINSQATCLPVSAIPERHGRAIDLGKPVQSKQRAFNYVYHKGCVFSPIQIQSGTQSRAIPCQRSKKKGQLKIYDFCQLKKN